MLFCHLSLSISLQNLLLVQTTQLPSQSTLVHDCKFKAFDDLVDEYCMAINQWTDREGKTEMNLCVILQTVTFKKFKKFLKDASKTVKYVWPSAKFRERSLPQQSRVSKPFTEQTQIGTQFAMSHCLHHMC